jgi:hypothetical protein
MRTMRIFEAVLWWEPSLRRVKISRIEIVLIRGLWLYITKI